MSVGADGLPYSNDDLDLVDDLLDKIDREESEAVITVDQQDEIYRLKELLEQHEEQLAVS